MLGPGDLRCPLAINKHDHECLIPISLLAGEPLQAILMRDPHKRQIEVTAGAREGGQCVERHTGLNPEHSTPLDFVLPVSVCTGTRKADWTLIDWITWLSLFSGDVPSSTNALTFSSVTPTHTAGWNETLL